MTDVRDQGKCADEIDQLFFEFSGSRYGIKKQRWQDA